MVFLLRCVVPLSLPVLVERVPLDPLTDEAKVSLERLVLLLSSLPSSTLSSVELLSELPVLSMLLLSTDDEEGDIDAAVKAVPDDLAVERGTFEEVSFALSAFLVAVLLVVDDMSLIFRCPFLFQRASRPRWRLSTPRLDSCSKSESSVVWSLSAVGALLTSRRVAMVYMAMVLGIDGDESSRTGPGDGERRYCF